MFENKSRTPLSNLGEFKLIEQLTKDFSIESKNTEKGVVDDDAVL